MYIHICVSADTVGVWSFKFDWVRFEIRRQVKSKVRRRGSEVERSDIESEGRSAASRSKAIDESHEFRLGGPRGPREFPEILGTLRDPQDPPQTNPRPPKKPPRAPSVPHSTVQGCQRLLAPQ